jgi:hypothetical protein
MARHHLPRTLVFALADGAELLVEAGAVVAYSGDDIDAVLVQGEHPRSRNREGLRSLLKSPGDPNVPFAGAKIVPKSEKNKPPPGVMPE